MLMAKAFPNSEFVGYDFHPSSIEAAKAHATENGVSANTQFKVATTSVRFAEARLTTSR
jgi:methylase of polypeptide subunit release factors